MSLRIAVLVKQVPRFEELSLGPDGRIDRSGLELELNPYCRRAVAKGVELARRHGGTCTVLTLGPPSAEDCLREAIAWGADEGILISDPAFAGSDTLATAKALAAALERRGPFDLVLAGRNSVDADTGQVAPQVAELLGLSFLCGVHDLALDDDRLTVECELDDGWLWAEANLPAVLSCAERLCEPAKVSPEGRALVAPETIRHLDALALGPGPWGVHASRTVVGEVHAIAAGRRQTVLDGPVEDQVRKAAVLLGELGVTCSPQDGRRRRHADAGVVPDGWQRRGSCVAVLAEPGRLGVTRELVGAAARLASTIGAAVRVVAVDEADLDPAALSRWGADEVLQLVGVSVEEDVARSVASWCADEVPWAVLAPSTAWGREVASRVAARVGAGLTGDAVDLDVVDGRLVAWKPAFGGSIVAAITATSPTQMATVRPGVLALPAERQSAPVPVVRVTGTATSRVVHTKAVREDDVGELAVADAVVGVGAGVAPEDYPLLEPFLALLGAELAATRKVTDRHWLPRARQVGITGRSISPAVYVAVGVSGKFNHMMGVRAAGLVLAINADPDAPVFEAADVGIVGDWHDVLPLLVSELTS